MIRHILTRWSAEMGSDPIQGGGLLLAVMVAAFAMVVR